MTLPDQTATAASSIRHARWWGVLGGLLLGVIDTALASSLGFSFEINGQPAGAWMAAYFGSSFAFVGYLLGVVIEARQRDRRASAIIQAQMETLNQARARLAQSEKLAALGQLAASVAHEVRNPLAVIRSAAQGLGEALPAHDEEARRASAFITAEIDRLNSVITSLLTFARPPQLQPRPVAVREIFDRAVLLAREDLAAKAVRVARREDADIPLLTADADLLSQVLLCLLANAAEAVPVNGEVGLEASVRNGAVELGVRDSGPGVPPDLRERIFEPFFTTRTRGTGLGLAIARQIVEAHGGRIAAGVAAGGGARFTITLPTTPGAVLAA